MKIRFSFVIYSVYISSVCAAYLLPQCVSFVLYLILFLFLSLSLVIYIFYITYLSFKVLCQ